LIVPRTTSDDSWVNPSHAWKSSSGSRLWQRLLE